MFTLLDLYASASALGGLLRFLRVVLQERLQLAREGLPERLRPALRAAEVPLGHA